VVRRGYSDSTGVDGRVIYKESAGPRAPSTSARKPQNRRRTTGYALQPPRHAAALQLIGGAAVRTSNQVTTDRFTVTCSACSTYPCDDFKLRATTRSSASSRSSSRTAVA